WPPPSRRASSRRSTSTPHDRALRRGPRSRCACRHGRAPQPTAEGRGGPRRRRPRPRRPVRRSPPPAGDRMTTTDDTEALLDGFWPYRKTTEAYRTVPAEPVDRALLLDEIATMARTEDAQGDAGHV